MKQKKTTKAKANTDDGNGRKQYYYEPSCEDCNTLKNTGFTTKAKALILIAEHRAESAAHRSFVTRIEKTPASHNKGIALKTGFLDRFRPYCNSCNTFRNAPYTDKPSAVDGFWDHHHSFPSHICGVEIEK